MRVDSSAAAEATVRPRGRRVSQCRTIHDGDPTPAVGACPSCRPPLTGSGTPVQAFTVDWRLVLGSGPTELLVTVYDSSTGTPSPTTVSAPGTSMSPSTPDSTGTPPTPS